MHNHRPEPLQLHSGQNTGVLEVVTLADTPPTISQPGSPRRPSLPERLSPLQQQQLNFFFFKSLATASVREKTISGVLHCWSTRSRPMGLRTASPIDDRTRLFDRRRWCRSSRCWLATSSAPPTVRRLCRWQWLGRRTVVCVSVLIFDS